MSLVVQYRLDEASGSLGTDSVGSLDMTNTTVTSVSDATYGDVAYFDGSSRLALAAASLPTAITGTNSRTISYWVKPTGTFTSAQTFHSVGSGNGTGARWRFNMYTSGVLQHAYNNLSAIENTTALVADTWYNIAQTFNGTNVTIYVDGVLETTAAKALITQTDSDLVIGAWNENLTSSPYTGCQLDFRLYDGALDATAVGDIYAAGPHDRNLLSATMYTHLADLAWSAVSGATTYTVTQTEDSGDPVTIVYDTTDLTFTSYNLTPGSSYEYNLYTDLDLLIPESTTTESALAVDTTSVTDLMIRLGNDLTLIDESSVDDIESELRNVLSTGDEVSLASGVSIFVQDADTIEFIPGKDVLTPFVPILTSQAVTVTTAEGDSSAISYNQILNQVTVDSTILDIGQYAVVGKYKVKVIEK